MSPLESEARRVKLTPKRVGTRSATFTSTPSSRRWAASLRQKQKVIAVSTETLDFILALLVRSRRDNTSGRELPFPAVGAAAGDLRPAKSLELICHRSNAAIESRRAPPSWFQKPDRASISQLFPPDAPRILTQKRELKII